MNEPRENNGSAPAVDDEKPRRPLMSRKEVAEYLGVHRQTVAALQEDDVHPLPFLLVGGQYRYRPEEVEAWAEDAADAKDV